MVVIEEDDDGTMRIFSYEKTLSMSRSMKIKLISSIRPKKNWRSYQITKVFSCAYRITTKE